MSPGCVFGQYRVTQKLGEGAMGEVFLGMDTMLDREVALKVLRPELARQSHVVERFRAEARTLAQMHHPNIAAVHAIVREGDYFCIVMEYVPGITLDQRIRRDGALAFGDAMAVFGQVLAGVEHAHSMGIIHRDLKPGNLILTPRGQVKVMDFGIARALGARRMTGLGRVVGTLEYMSPEQVRGQDATAASDIYSLGIVLYEMLTGQVPFCTQSEFELMRAHLEVPPPPPRVHASWISPNVEAALMRALEKKPEGRFRSTAEFAVALSIPLDSATDTFTHIPAPPTRISYPFGSPSRPASKAWKRRLEARRAAGGACLAGREILLCELLPWLRKYYYTPALLFVAVCVVLALALRPVRTPPAAPISNTVHLPAPAIAPELPIQPPVYSQPETPTDQTKPPENSDPTGQQKSPAVAPLVTSPTRPKRNTTKGAEDAIDYLKSIRK